MNTSVEPSRGTGGEVGIASGPAARAEHSFALAAVRWPHLTLLSCRAEEGTIAGGQKRLRLAAVLKLALLMAGSRRSHECPICLWLGRVDYP